eukprot:8753691-Pyramimonas_sp.AAC.1
MLRRRAPTRLARKVLTRRHGMKQPRAKASEKEQEVGGRKGKRRRKKRGMVTGGGEEEGNRTQALGGD